MTSSSHKYSLTNEFLKIVLIILFYFIFTGLDELILDFFIL